MCILFIVAVVERFCHLGSLHRNVHHCIDVDDLPGQPLGRVRGVRDVLTFKGVVTLAEQ